MKHTCTCIDTKLLVAMLVSYAKVAIIVPFIGIDFRIITDLRRGILGDLVL